MSANGDANSLVADKSFSHRVFDHLYIAGPIVLSFVCRKSGDVLSVVAVGHLGPHFLASAGLASVTANVTGNSMIMGLSGALSTLCSQANGANDKEELCLVLQRALLILSICVCVPVTVLWTFSAPIMEALAQSREISASAHQYLLCLVPGLWALSGSSCMQQWLFAQGNTRPVAAITVVLALLHPVWIYLFVFHLQVYPSYGVMVYGVCCMVYGV
jgi:MATE family multidrug resistance protein